MCIRDSYSRFCIYISRIQMETRYLGSMCINILFHLDYPLYNCLHQLGWNLHRSMARTRLLDGSTRSSSGQPTLVLLLSRTFDLWIITVNIRDSSLHLLHQKGRHSWTNLTLLVVIDIVGVYYSQWKDALAAGRSCSTDYVPSWEIPRWSLLPDKLE